MAQTLEALVEKEFAEVQKAREELLAKRKEIDEQLLELEKRFNAAQTYKAMREGKLPPTDPRTRRSSTGNVRKGPEISISDSQSAWRLEDFGRGRLASLVTAMITSPCFLAPGRSRRHRTDAVWGRRSGHAVLCSHARSRRGSRRDAPRGRRGHARAARAHPR
jgi:hypothetical protein